MKCWLYIILLFISISEPISAQWVVVGQMKTPRVAFQLARDSSKIYLVGGRQTDNKRVLTACETFDLTTHQFSPIASMSEARQNGNCVVLHDGTVYMPSGLCNLADCMTPTCEIYDPATNKWSYTTNLIEAREAESMVVLPNGSVLIVAGALAPHGPYRNTCELYNPHDRSVKLTGSITYGQFGNMVFYDSAVHERPILISDHYNGANGTWVDATEEYDIATGKWTLTARSASPHGSWMEQAVQLPSGEIVAPSGSDAPNSTTPLIEVYNPKTQQWRTIGTVLTPRHLASSAYIGADSVLLVGGYDYATASPLTSTEIINVKTGEVTPGPTLNESRYFHRMITVREFDTENPCTETYKVYVFGGETKTGAARSSCEMVSFTRSRQPELIIPDTLRFTSTVCQGVDTSFVLSSSTCESIRVDTVEFQGIENSYALLKTPHGLLNSTPLKIPLAIHPTESGVWEAKLRIVYVAGFMRHDTTVTVMVTTSPSKKGTVEVQIRDTSGSTIVEVPIWLENTSGDQIDGVKATMRFNTELLTPIVPKFDGTLLESAGSFTQTKQPWGMTLDIPSAFTLSASKPLVVLRFTVSSLQANCTDLILAGLNLGTSECEYAVIPDTAIVCRAAMSVPQENTSEMIRVSYDAESDRILIRHQYLEGMSTVRLFDAAGRMLAEHHLEMAGGMASLIADALPSGVVFIELRTREVVARSSVVVVK